MTTTRIYPSAWRIFAAFLLVPEATAMALAGVMPLYAGVEDVWERFWLSFKAFAVFGAYPPTIILGIPAYLILRERLDATFVNCALVGAIVATLPWLLLSLFSHMDYASIGGRVTDINGWPTAYGLLLTMQYLGQIALLGALAGSLFWFISAAGTNSRQSHT